MTLSDDDRRRVVSAWFEKADQALVDTATLLGQRSATGAMNRCYYAMFYSLLALAARDACHLHKHSALISYFHREYVKPGRVPKEMGKALSRAFQNRSESDYRTTCIALEDVSELLDQARRFVAEVKSLLQAT
jgi:uncharacterized protein (UPF0332 family)